ncbi:trichohyalin-like isoform X2 [Ruditapes philippinarum]|uniref:trichohyalin-like isoform X2 n=1 Tax=Ruditapes philippinarum TaxID=129788 RepID=UPI00295AE123|nr:trichohyalin-like isoform X2 [Ruditapes philippinarum]
MAEGGKSENAKNTLPIRGKVRQVRQEWAVYEDGAFAHQLQNEEIDRHYGLNRFNRRTVREDIPLAKVVQSDEELRLQNERFQELQALRAQAEEDEKVAKRLMEQEQLQNQASKMAIELTDEHIAKELMEQDQLQNEARKMARELTDEEYAKAIQEKEKQKYERHLEKKKLQKLKKEREKIEKTQAQRTEEARLNVRGSTEDLDDRMAEMNVQNGGVAMRVTPGGKIEDDGDFSDFYCLPENVDPAQRQVLQEMQDEELARLLQEQEHKRSKAEVDKDKLREIEEQDKRLAQIIEEQEKIRLKKAKQKWKQQQDIKRAQEAANRPPALPPRNQDHDHRRYRRNSFILSMENGNEDDDHHDISPHSQGSSEDYLTPMQASEEHRLQSSQGQRSNSNRNVQSDISLNNSVPTREIKQNKQNVQKVRNNIHGGRNEQNYDPAYLPTQEMPDVERWLASQPPDATRGRLRSDNSDHIPDSPSPPGSYHSEDPLPYHGNGRISRHDTSTDNSSHYAVSDPFNFNIAAAIDPTYTRRSEATTDRKQVIHPVTRPLPHEEWVEIEWDPSVSGSIRGGSLSRFKDSKNLNYGYKDRTMSTVSSREDSFHDDGPGVVSPFVPVQGQRRNMGERSQKGRKPNPSQMTDKQKNSCKQQ